MKRFENIGGWKEKGERYLSTEHTCLVSHFTQHISRYIGIHVQIEYPEVINFITLQSFVVLFTRDKGRNTRHECAITQKAFYIQIDSGWNSGLLFVKYGSPSIAHLIVAVLD